MIPNSQSITAGAERLMNKSVSKTSSITLLWLRHTLNNFSKLLEVFQLNHGVSDRDSRHNLTNELIPLGIQIRLVGETALHHVQTVVLAGLG